MIQKSLPNEGMVGTQPLVPQNTTSASLIQPIDPCVHHLMTLSYDVNLHTQHSQYLILRQNIPPPLSICPYIF